MSYEEDNLWADEADEADEHECDEGGFGFCKGGFAMRDDAADYEDDSYWDGYDEVDEEDDDPPEYPGLDDQHDY